MFALDKRISKNSVHVTNLQLCEVRVQNDARFPWIILVPRVEDIKEVHQLNEEQQSLLIKESSRLASVLQTTTRCHKINVANLGNVVAQLHWHVVARFKDDESWPGPIWGDGDAVAYEDDNLTEFCALIRHQLSNNDE